MHYGQAWALSRANMIKQKAEATLARTSSPVKARKCCTRVQVLEFFLFISLLMHILVLSIGCSVLLSSDRKYVQFGGYEFYSSQTGPDLVVIGVLGGVFSLAGLIGVWKRNRVMIIPLMFYLCIFLLVDCTSFAAFNFNYSWTSQDVLEDMENLEVLHIDEFGMVNMKPRQEFNNSSLMVGLFIKIIFNIIFLKVLVDVYRKDVIMRTSRSPIRTQTQPTQEESTTPVKPGKYVQIV